MKANGVELPLFIEGEAGPGSAWVERQNPARTTETVGRVATADAGETRRAIEAASRAFPAWSSLGLDEREARLMRAAEALRARDDELAQLLARELGKVLPDCKGELAFANAFLKHSIDATRRLGINDELDDEQGRLLVTRRPYGVVGAITPWNAPVLLAMLKVGPALATGNVVVVKPSPLVPLAVTQTLITIAELLPPGVLNVVQGEAGVGSTLVSHSKVRKVAFTGGVVTARSVMRGAAETIKPLVLELGGNDPAIFLNDADLSPETMTRAVFGTFLNSGQVCMAAKRLYVHESILADFVDAYREAADAALVVGDPLNEEVTVGPMASPEGVARVEELLEDARAQGGTVHTLGQVQSGFALEEGWFLRPSLVTGLGDDARLVREEQFGPTVPVLSFQDEEELLVRINDSELALASSVWSADEERAFALAQRVEAGFTFVNCHNRVGLSLRAPFGGWKQSGFGREFGDAGVAEYLQLHTINRPATVRASGTSTTGRAYPGV
jgi:acyl-CoA reductase-like NAD-dependent aldehyde dehydrogenase